MVTAEGHHSEGCGPRWFQPTLLHMRGLGSTRAIEEHLNKAEPSSLWTAKGCSHAPREPLEGEGALTVAPLAASGRLGDTAVTDRYFVKGGRRPMH